MSASQPFDVCFDWYYALGKTKYLVYCELCLIYDNLVELLVNIVTYQIFGKLHRYPYAVLFRLVREREVRKVPEEVKMHEAHKVHEAHEVHEVREACEVMDAWYLLHQRNCLAWL